jgi:uncharacterized membrane protein (UPF0127 family)
MGATIRIKKICCTPEERAKGLQFEELAPGECCVFVYDTPHMLRFWGKNTPQDLSLSFVYCGMVVETATIAAYDETPVISNGIASIVIESLEPIEAGSVVRFEGDCVRVTPCSE